MGAKVYLNKKKGALNPVRRETADTHPLVLCRPPPITPCRVGTYGQVKKAGRPVWRQKGRPAVVTTLPIR